MSRDLVYLSFFKTNQIDYIYRPNLSTIEFPCIHCSSVATMVSQTSDWTCNRCKQTGNIINLIEYSKHNSFKQMFVPKKEEKSIVGILNRLSKKYPQEHSLFALKNKVKTLIKYYEETP